MKGLPLAVASVIVLGCASPGPDFDGTTARSTTFRDVNVITTEEIVDSDARTASELVRRLRPQWLRGRGPASINNGGDSLPVVYVDDLRVGGIEYLERLSCQIIREVSFMNGRDASVRYGLNHGGGVIMVMTMR